MVVGETNDKYVVIEKGLDEGQNVVLDARARLADEVKKEEHTAPAGDQKSPAPAPAPVASAAPVPAK